MNKINSIANKVLAGELSYYSAVDWYADRQIFREFQHPRRGEISEVSRVEYNDKSYLYSYQTGLGDSMEFRLKRDAIDAYNQDLEDDIKTFSKGA